MKQAKLKFPVRMFALLCGLLLSVGAFAQNISVNGHVKDANGEPIIGATVRVDGTTAGAISDLDGNFTLEAAKGSTLSVSYVGYTTAKVTVAPNVMVTLQEDTKALNEVVVIGYGTAKKEDLTGSVAAINPDEMSKGITNNASDMLVGKVAGVDVQTAGGAPGAGAQIRIRGGASLTASNDPLYVIDGLVIDNNTAKGMSNILAMINPNDIETFTVLKDASAAAIYGSRASNGVIIITTKKGRAGSKPKFSYNGDITLSTIAKKYDVLSGDQYRDLVSKVSPENLSSLGTANNDWQKHIFKDVFSHHHSLSMSGGLKNMPYRVSVGIDNDKGIVKTSWMDRFNASLNVAPSFLKDHLRFNITAKYMYEKDRYVDAGTAIGAALDMDPTQPIMGVGDDYKYFGGYYQTLNSASFADPTWKYTANSVAPQNPVAYLNQHSTRANANDLSGNIEMDVYKNGTTFQAEPIIDMSQSSIFSKYMAFLGGDHMMTVLTNNDLPDAPNCVVYKDSYGNPFVLYLTQHYHRVYALDFRQYDAMGMRSFIQAYHINDVILAESMSKAMGYGAYEQLDMRLGY